MIFIYTFLYPFLVLSGMYAIVVTLVNLSRGNKQSPANSSGIEMKWFKYNAPAGFVYGMFAFLLVLGLMRFDDNTAHEVAEMKSEISTLESELASIKMLALPFMPDTLAGVVVTITSSKATSMFGSRVLVTLDRGAFGPSKLYFEGIRGISESADGQFSNSSVSIDTGTRFFIKLTSNEVWGVNVLEGAGYWFKLEFYKPL